MQIQTLLAKNWFFDRMLPISLFFTRSSVRAAWHNHEFSEISIICNGHCIYETEFSVEPIARGDVVVMPAGGAHRFRDEVDIEQFNILFQFEKLFVPSRDICRNPGGAALFRLTSEYCLQNRYYPRFHLNDADLKRIVLLLSDAYTTMQTQRSGCSLSVYGAFLQTIPILLDNYVQSSNISKPSSLPARLGECLDYMQLNFRKNLSIGKLARHYGMTQTTFIRHFKAATGVTPLNYLLHLRIDEACHLLLDGTLMVSEIALQTGFADSNYFSRIFQQKTGLTPRQFRQKQGII